MSIFQDGRIRALLKEMLAMLKEVEFFEIQEPGSFDVCPICLCDRKHTDDCRLAGLIAKAEAVMA